MTITSRSFCRLSSLALASALVALLGACGGGGGDVPTESPLAVGGPCKARNERTGEQYKQTANPVSDAIAGATAGDTIRIWGVCYGNFVLDKDLTLKGQGAKATLDGGNSGTVLTVASGVNANVNDLTITHGSNTFTGTGGGIFSAGMLIINNSTISGNAAGAGGGIFNSYGMLSITNSTVTGNTADFGGGGIYNGTQSVMSLTNSGVSGNNARTGGGIDNFGTLSLTNTSVSDNIADTSGGGISNYGTLTLTDSRVSGNNADYAGGIYNYFGTLILTNSSVTGNEPDNIYPPLP